MLLLECPVWTVLLPATLVRFFRDADTTSGTRRPPTGTGKTLLARTLARDMGCAFLSLDVADVSSSSLSSTSGGAGGGERYLRSFFVRAADAAPCVVFIDEMDALCGTQTTAGGRQSTRLLATLLHCIDKICDAPAPRNRVMLLGATNRRFALDASIRRPGRFDREVEIGVPNPGARGQILRNMLRRMVKRPASSVGQVPASRAISGGGADDSVESKEADPTKSANSGNAVGDGGVDESDAWLAELGPAVDHVVRHTHGFVGADLQALCRTASLLALERWQQAQENHNSELSSSSPTAQPPELRITADDLRVATKRTRPSALRAFYLEVPDVRWGDIGGQELAKQQIREAVEWPLRHPEAFARLGIRPPKGAVHAPCAYVGLRFTL